MTSTMNSAFDYFLNIIHNTSVFSSGNSFIIVLVFGLLISIIISLKKISNIKTLMFPVLYGLFLLDFTVPIVILVLAGFVFVLDILSIQVIGSIISTASGGFEAVRDRFSYENRVSKDIKRYNQRTQHLTALKKYGDTFDKKIWLMNKKDRNKYMKILQNRQFDEMEKEREEIHKRNRLQEQ